MSLNSFYIRRIYFQFCAAVSKAEHNARDILWWRLKQSKTGDLATDLVTSDSDGKQALIGWILCDVEVDARDVSYEGTM